MWTIDLTDGWKRRSCWEAERVTGRKTVQTYRKTKNTAVNMAARCFEVLSHSTELRLNSEEAKLRRFPVNTCQYEIWRNVQPDTLLSGHPERFFGWLLMRGSSTGVKWKNWENNLKTLYPSCSCSSSGRRVSAGRRRRRQTLSAWLRGLVRPKLHL